MAQNSSPKPKKETESSSDQLNKINLNKTMTVTRYSLPFKQAELQKLEDQRKKTMEALQIAREDGDLRENFGYQQGRRDLDMINRQIGELQGEMAQVVNQIDPYNWTIEEEEPEYCAIGTIVEFQRDDQTPQTLLIGGAWDTHSEDVISYLAPLAKALILKEPGETTKLPHDEDTTIKILSVKIPTEEQIERAYPPIEMEKKVTRSKSKQEFQPSM